MGLTLRVAFRYVDLMILMARDLIKGRLVGKKKNEQYLQKDFTAIKCTYVTNKISLRFHDR